MKKKTVIIVLLLVIGLGFILYGMVNYLKGTDNKNNNSSIPDVKDTDTIISKSFPLTSYSEDKLSELIVNNYELVFYDNNSVYMSVELENKTPNDIDDQLLQINFYKENEIIDTYEYTIKDLKSSSIIIFETELPVNYKNIT